MANAALLEGQPAIGQAAMERTALVFGGGDLQDLGKAVARTWLGAARELMGDPVSRDSRASFILLYIETAVRYDPDLARQDAALVTEAPKKLAAAKDSPRSGVPTEGDLKVVMDREVHELERSVEKAKARRTEGDIRTLATAFEKRGLLGCPEDKGTAVELSDPRRDLVFYNGGFVQSVR